MPLNLALAVRGTVAGHRLGALEGWGGGGVTYSPSNASLRTPRVCKARVNFFTPCVGGRAVPQAIANPNTALPTESRLRKLRRHCVADMLHTTKALCTVQRTWGGGGGGAKNANECESHIPPPP